MTQIDRNRRWQIMQIGLIGNAILTILLTIGGIKPWISPVLAALTAVAALFKHFEAWLVITSGFIFASVAQCALVFDIVDFADLKLLVIREQEYWFLQLALLVLLVAGSAVMFQLRNIFDTKLVAHKNYGRLFAAALVATMAVLQWMMLPTPVPSQKPVHAAEAVFLGEGGNFARSTESKYFYIHNTESGEIKKMQARTSINCLSASPDGKLLAVGIGMPESESRIYFEMWDVDSRKALRFSRSAPALWQNPVVLKMAFSRDSRYLATVVKDTGIEVWDVKQGTLVKAFDLKEQIKALFNGFGEHLYTIAFSPDGKRLLAGGGRGALHIIDIAGGRIEKSLKSEKRSLIEQVAYSPSGAVIYAAINKQNEDKKSLMDGWIDVWDVKSHRLINSLPGRSKDGYEIQRLSCSANGKRLATGGGGEIKVWDINQEDKPVLIYEWQTGTVMIDSLCLSPNGEKLLATGTLKGGGKILLERTIPDSH